MLLKKFRTHQSPNFSHFLASMTQSPISRHSVRVGEVLTLVMGFGISTLAVCARIYTKMRIIKTFVAEDCELAPLCDSRFQAVFS